MATTEKNQADDRTLECLHDMASINNALDTMAQPITKKLGT